MQPRGFKPDILALGAHLAPLLDELAGCHHPSCMLLQTRRCYPSRRMFGVGLDEGVEQHACPLDVANLCIGLDNDAVK